MCVTTATRQLKRTRGRKNEKKHVSHVTTIKNGTPPTQKGAPPPPPPQDLSQFSVGHTCAAPAQVSSHHGHSLRRRYWRTSRWPPRAAWRQAQLFQGQPLLRANSMMSTWPPRAAAAQVDSSHGHSMLWAHRSSSKCPPNAAPEHTFFGDTASAVATQQQQQPNNAATAKRVLGNCGAYVCTSYFWLELRSGGHCFALLRNYRTRHLEALQGSH